MKMDKVVHCTVQSKLCTSASLSVIFIMGMPLTPSAMVGSLLIPPQSDPLFNGGIIANPTSKKLNG